ncbi:MULTISPECIES: DUF397 domain-containing protein [unclassified Streptomyces]|uniref:DUF397 domain-containing protein n=1 Tax=Streptomyces salyersiae TaxID=3075530 RepID=A0ABU2RN64_9ACTN|nr:MULTISPECIES: DUF397 domain-containing protein [unclassified Streptomyces]AEN09560.1 protein of unknown function DUF397 [Streptomyces sp. SirexAA-E]MDT0430295.1 DUF397 domain-containing protein [Streptomyces sp. DSM 41770]MYR70196.1 DUF397 domain-containing protein [Streptomyces sp. SID4939]MYT64580.1 DUF397 domain-containing protein [Streptomyces sp. SID8357]MYT87393.1 DUF397 domain-containing protein [Streptomyces sp. SID8360]
MIHNSSAEEATGPHWHRSSYSSSGDGNDCVEVATAPGTVHVRDSKNLPGPRLGFAPTAWNAFVAHTSGR